MENARAHTLALGLGLALVVAAVGCGGESQPVASPVHVDRMPEATDAIVERVTVPATNLAPSIDSIRFDPEEPVAGETVRALIEASDPEGDSLWFRYAWTLEGEPVGVNGSELVLHDGVKGQSVELTVWANDGKSESAAASEWTDIDNTRPRIIAVAIEPRGAIVAGMDITARPEARDADGDAFTLRYEWTVDGRRMREQGPVLSTRNLRRGDVVQVSIDAHDGQDTSESMRSPELPIMNAPPHITSRPGETSQDGVFRYHVKAEDPDGDSEFQFHLDQAPDGMSVDPRDGTVTWKPGPDQSGTHVISVAVDDLHGGRSRQSFEIVVGAPDPGAPPARLER